MCTYIFVCVIEISMNRVYRMQLICDIAEENT